MRNYPQPHDSARKNGLLTSACVLQKSGPASATNAPPALTETHLVEGGEYGSKGH